MKIKLRGKLLFFFITILLAFGVVLFSVTHIQVTKLAKHSLTEKLNSDSKLGYSLLNEKYKGDWSIKDGKLYKGENLINENYSIVDEITKQTESFSTIFMQDTRVSTSVLKPDGSRAVGTKVSEKVGNVVLKDGKEFFGEVTILDKKYEAKYIPLKDRDGKIIGIWFVGSQKRTLDLQIKQLDNIILLFTVITLIIGAIILNIFVNSIVKNVKKILMSLKAITKGDFKLIAEIKGNDEIGEIANNVNLMVESFGNLIKEIAGLSLTVSAASEKVMTSSNEVSKVSEQVASAINEVAQGASEQAASTEKGNIMILEIVDGLDKISFDMNNSDELAKKTKDTVDIGEKSVLYQELKMNENRQVSLGVAAAINQLSSKSNEIGQILEVIKGIAEQTNLLALNAAIEAARAGEQGKGFAVVADEIRRLAEQSGLSVRKISEIIKDVQSGVEHAVTEMGKAEKVVDDQSNALADSVKAFKDVSDMVLSISENIKRVSKASTVLYHNAQQASDAISDIASVSEETAAGSEEVLASTQEQTSIIHQIKEESGELSLLANNLHNSIQKFRV